MNQLLTALINYGLKNNLITNDDVHYAANRVLALIGETAYTPEEPTGAVADYNIEQILKGLTDIAYKNGKLEDDLLVYHDLMSARIMDNFTPRPSELIEKFYQKHESDPQKATDYFYHLSRKNNYIMMERVKKDLRWKTQSVIGEIDLSINLSKPEKTPEEIAAAKLAPPKETAYPKCLLCVENVGYDGHITHPPRANHRIIPLKLDSADWCMQYSPYVYYNEHCIVFNRAHVPMRITKQTFKNLLCFVEKFPHYFIGSNADLPIVGGSILTHDHYQGGNYEFPMAKRGYRDTFTFKGYEDIDAGSVDWALSTIRLKGTDIDRLVELGGKILDAWRAYSDEENEILAHTDAPHNTITPIARMRDGKYELDLILRNNRTDEKHPDGIFHPHKKYHHIKRENIGLIEAMGLAVLPARLVKELAPVDDAKKEEIGQIFGHILQNCGVFKDTDKGRAGMLKFMQSIK